MGKLELLSQFGDYTVANYRYVVHWTGNATETESVLDAGLEIIEGQPVFSTSLVHPYGTGVNHGGEPGSMLICAVPMNYHLGYGVFTTAYVDRSDKAVLGSALSYAEGRKRLALYASEDTNAAMKRVESEVNGGFPLDQHSRMLVDPRFVLGLAELSMDFDRLVAKIDTAVRGFEAIDIQRAAMAFEPVVRPVNQRATELLLPALKELVQGTIEAIVITKLRVMRWQGLSLQGYQFFEGQQEVGIAPVRDTQEQLQRLMDFGKRAVESSIFRGSLTWLNNYVAHELAVMKVELESAAMSSNES